MFRGIICAALAAQSPAVSQIKIVSETMPSGYRVVIAKTPPVPGRSPRIYVGSYVLHGVMQDNPFGWAHLMEHVVANNRASIVGPVRPQGVNFLEGNALTRPYYTSFVSVLPPELLASTVHSRMARAGRVENDSTVFATQVDRVLAELERDMSGTYPAYKALVALSIHQPTRLSDELALIRKTDRADLAKEIHRIYKPQDAVLVIAGDLDVDSTLALVRETHARLQFGNGKSGNAVRSARLRFGESAVIEGQNKTGMHVVGIGWEKPRLGDDDQIPLLIADQLLLGRGASVEDPSRSDSSPVAMRLTRSLGGSAFWDGRAGKWQAPDIVDTGEGIYAIVFKTDRSLTARDVRDSVNAALRDIRRNEMSDKAIDTAKERLASFYEQWFFEPTYRILGDHLMAYAVTGRDPDRVKQIPNEIRRVKPLQVRRAFDRYLLKAKSNVVILP